MRGLRRRPMRSPFSRARKGVRVFGLFGIRGAAAGRRSRAGAPRDTQFPARRPPLAGCAEAPHDAAGGATDAQEHLKTQGHWRGKHRVFW